LPPIPSSAELRGSSRLPRPKKPRVYTIGPPSPEARTELWTNIGDVLTFANKHVATAWHDSEAPFRSLGEAIHQVLTSFAVGGSGRFEHWPAWAATGVLNIHRLITTGGWYLRRCRDCDHWFLAHDKRRRRCRAVACRQAAARQKSRAARQRERDRQRAAKRKLHLVP
jgi:hypothetical protein